MYNKLFTTILDSSIWLEPTHVRIVWITLLAAMDKDGYAHFSAIGNLSSRAKVSDEDAADAVKVLMSPDPHNPEQPNDGRRIERVPGGYMVLNAAKYRAIHDAEMQLEANRLRVAKWRANQAEKEAKKSAKIAKKGSRTKAQAKVNHSNGEAAFEKAVNDGASDDQALVVARQISGDDELEQKSKEAEAMGL
jgi:hypothetical protein